MKNELLSIAMFCCLAGCNSPSGHSTQEIWYTQPAEEWIASLPLGNGRLGVMVAGGINEETLALNEVTLWSGQPDDDANELCGKEQLEKMREFFFKGDLQRGNELATEHLSGKSKSFGTHLPLGDIKIKYLNSKSGVSDYRRTLDLEQAVATVTYTQDNVRYKREYFCSNPDEVLAVRLTADKPGALSTAITYNLLREANVFVSDKGLRASGTVSFPKLGEGGVTFTNEVKVEHRGGKSIVSDSDFTIYNADTIFLYTDVRTDYTGINPEEVCGLNVNKAVRLGYDKLKGRHIADYTRLYDRMSIRLSNGEKSKANLPTDERWERIKRGENDPDFDALFYQYGRYMLISSSRESSPLPANLQGIWNDNLACNMGWTCDYHFDINIQQNYWSANVANLPECNTPLFKFLEKLAVIGNETARKVYGCDGWCAHTVVNAWGYTAPGGGVGWGLHPTAGAWMATHLWTHYLYTGDTKYLGEVGYPLLKETAKFFKDYAVIDPVTGYLVTGPSISPENAFRTKEGDVWCLSMMPTVDLAVMDYIYRACIESARILNIDSEFAQSLEEDIKRLPPFRKDSKGEFAEWALDVERADPAHRHSSHLLPLYPFGQISYTKSPELMEASRRAIEGQLQAPGWEDTEWSRANMLCFYARLKDGEEAHRSLVELYSKFMRENLMTVSPAGIAGAESDIFSFDANEASVAGISEMLIQSFDGFIEFLPALPAIWKEGEVKGICAEGGIVCNLSWKKSTPVSIEIMPNHSQTAKIYLQEKWGTPTFKVGKNVINPSCENGCYTLNMKPNEVIIISYK